MIKFILNGVFDVLKRAMELVRDMVLIVLISTGIINLAKVLG